MIRGRSSSLAKLKGSRKKSRESSPSSRLAEMSARIDSTRSTSVVRKPVFDRSLNVVAYEVVLGDGPITSISVQTEALGPQLIVNTGVAIDPAAMSADKPIQLTLTSDVLDAGLPSEITPDQYMLILGAGVEPSAAMVEAVQALHVNGFKIVLDDLTSNEHLHPLLRLATAVKINIGVASGPPLAKKVSLLKTASVDLIADGVASYDELRDATKLGFDQFQGTFLSRPEAFRKTRAAEGQLAALELITLLQNPDADISEIAEVIRRDVNLSYRILKVVNSARYSLPRPLGSIEEAVMLVGTKHIASWVGMMNMTGLNDKPTELTRSAMIRARVCEMLGDKLGRTDLQRFYLVGLFSVIEALLDLPAQQTLGSLPLSTEIVDAITSGGGIMGEVLHGVVAYEQGNFAGARIVGLQDSEIMGAFLAATIETDRVWSQLAE